jgi:predicted PurR-regulated permease PerM
VNPLATTIALILGGMMWGLAGMMLFIPLLGVLKVVFDRVENLKPLGYLIGEQDIPGAVISRRKNRKKQEP